jgi:hypothetical protein
MEELQGNPKKDRQSKAIDKATTVNTNKEQQFHYCAI